MGRRRSYNRGQWEVQRERCRLPPADPPPAFNAVPLSAVLPHVMGKWGLADRFWEQALAQDWENLVGVDIARVARPGRIDHKILTVFVRHSIWLSELSRFGRKQMLENLRTRFGIERIQDIRFVLDPEADAHPPAPATGQSR